MARISVEELFRGEGSGARYGAGGIICAVMREVMIYGEPVQYGERTNIEGFSSAPIRHPLNCVL